MDGNKSEFLDWLPTTILFQGLSTSQLVSLIGIAQFQIWQKDEVLFKQGHEATGFFVVFKDVPQCLAEYLLHLADQTSDVITLDLTKG
jgi:hypothetical protein